MQQVCVIVGADDTILVPTARHISKRLRMHKLACPLLSKANKTNKCAGSRRCKGEWQRLPSKLPGRWCAPRSTPHLAPSPVAGTRHPLDHVQRPTPARFRRAQNSQRQSAASCEQRLRHQQKPTDKLVVCALLCTTMMHKQRGQLQTPARSAHWRLEGTTGSVGTTVASAPRLGSQRAIPRQCHASISRPPGLAD